jgi:N6-L-threonylcarbamoyladenine synthase
LFILGIETSCDETAVAVVERGDKNSVLSEQIKSQIPLHAKYGGIVPEIAARTHYETIDLLTTAALASAGLTINDMEIIALTLGPGLIGSLLIGLCFAKGLSSAHKIPLVTVDHLLAHIESAFIAKRQIEYPLLGLVVSGGHTSLFLQKEKFQTMVLAKTRDDAVGEVFDKIAKHFGLGYPGGPILEKIGAGGNPQTFPFTQPRMSDGSDDFSFSGYKTAVLRLAKTHRIRQETPELSDLIASFSESVFNYLIEKALRAANKHRIRSLVVAGGVSRNSLLRKRFAEACRQNDLTLYLPEAAYCTDNAAMVAWLGYEKYLAYPNMNYFDLFLNPYARALFRENTKHR